MGGELVLLKIADKPEGPSPNFLQACVNMVVATELDGQVTQPVSLSSAVH